MHLSFWLLLPLLIIVDAGDIERGGIHDDDDHAHSDVHQCKGFLHGNKKNVLFSKCAVRECQDTCLNPTNSLGCTGKCKHGCVCAEGLIRNSVGECVLPLNCDVFPTCALMNEVFSYCGDDGCQSSCFRIVTTGCVPRCGTPRCICATGFIRHPDGRCIRPEMCPCPTNEIFNLCGCEGTCANPDTTACMLACPGARCVCQNGLVRDINGVCIMRSNCPQTCPAGQIFSMCGQDGCQETCQNPDTTGCMGICNTPGCICADGLVLDANNNCILPQDCPPMCPVGQIFSMCGQDGCQETCQNPDTTGCVPVCTTPSCVCADGLVLDANNNCIQPIDCPPTCPVGQMFSMCGQDGCQGTCDNPDTTGCIPQCNTPGCICANGLVLDANNNCIRPQDCPPTCPAGQIFSTCGQDGCQETCQNPDTTGCVPVCTTPSCVCADGLVLDANNNCILPANCPPIMCTGANEVFSTCGNNDCQITCLDMDPTGCNNVCTRGCICDVGFIRNFRGICVLPGDCESCPRPERYRMCGRGECESTCDQPDLGNDPNCDNSGMCIVGCFCVPGFIRDLTGTCRNPNQAICTILGKSNWANVTAGI